MTKLKQITEAQIKQIKNCWLQIQADQPQDGWFVILLRDGTAKKSDRISYGGGDRCYPADDRLGEMVDYWRVDTVDFVADPANCLGLDDDGYYSEVNGTITRYESWQEAWDFVSQGEGPDDEFEMWRYRQDF